MRWIAMLDTKIKLSMLKPEKYMYRKIKTSLPSWKHNKSAYPLLLCFQLGQLVFILQYNPSIYILIHWVHPIMISSMYFDGQGERRYKNIEFFSFQKIIHFHRMRIENLENFHGKRLTYLTNVPMNLLLQLRRVSLCISRPRHSIKLTFSPIISTSSHT